MYCFVCKPNFYAELVRLLVHGGRRGRGEGMDLDHAKLGAQPWQWSLSDIYQPTTYHILGLSCLAYKRSAGEKSAYRPPRTFETLSSIEPPSRAADVADHPWTI